MERRERLRKLMAAMDEDTVAGAFEALGPGFSVAEQAPIKEVFYTEGADTLLDARMQVRRRPCRTALGRAQPQSTYSCQTSHTSHARMCVRCGGSGLSTHSRIGQHPQQMRCPVVRADRELLAAEGGGPAGAGEEETGVAR